MPPAKAHSLIVPTSDTVRMELSCLTQGGFGFILLRKLHQAAFVSLGTMRNLAIP